MMPTPEEVNQYAMWACEALEHWADECDARAIETPYDEAVYLYRQREKAFRIAAHRFMKLIT